MFRIIIEIVAAGVMLAFCVQEIKRTVLEFSRYKRNARARGFKKKHRVWETTRQQVRRELTGTRGHITVTLKNPDIYESFKKDFANIEVKGLNTRI